MWFDFKTMFDQVTKCIEFMKKLGNFDMERIYQLNACIYEQFVHYYH
jgi:hypothetical protein